MNAPESRNWLRNVRTHFRALVQRERLDREMAEELRAHLEMQTRENVGAGMAPEEARRAALRQFGREDAIKETCREQRGFLCLDQLAQDVRYGLRTLRKSPGFTAAAVATLALGIGINTAIFSIISAVLLQPLPFPDSARLVEINRSHHKEAALAAYGASAPDYRDWREACRSFTRLGMCFYGDFRLTEGEELRPVKATYCSADMMPTLGIAPWLGRGFQREDERAGGVAIVGYDLWGRLFGSDTNLSGKSIIVNTQRVDVVGVMPQGFNYPPSRTELWLPLPETGMQFQNRSFTIGSVVGRLKPGVSLAQAQAEMDSIARQLREQYPMFWRDWGIRVTSLREKLISRFRPVLPILMAAAALILLIACANLGNLLLSRCLAREKELAIRAAVGAGSGRLVRQLMTESLLLSFLGAAAGFIAAAWSRGAWSVLAGPSFPLFAVIRIDANVWWFALGAAVLTGLLCGLIPAWRIWRTDLHEGLKQGGEHTTSGHSGGWLRSGLVVVQVSLALVLLIGAGLTLRSIYHQLHPGLLVDPRKVLVIDTDLPRQRYPGDQQRTAFFEQLIARLGAWPTVEAVAAASFTPFSGYGRGPIVLEDRPEGPDAPLRWTGSTSVSPEYFRTIGVPLLRGRDLTAQDRKGAPDVALVNETMATRYWPGEDPIGKLFAGGSGTNHGPWITVVGVVRDLRPSGIESDRDPEYYRPWLQAPSTRALVVRTSVNPGNLTPQVQALVREMDKALPAPKVGTLDNMLDNAAANTRVLGTLLSLFGVLALVLAVVGIYGVIAYTVTQRTHEFGVRMALGAQKAQVVFLVLRWGGRMALAGTVLGLVLAWICTRLMVGLVPGVSPRDMTTFLTVPWLLLAAALFGCYLPAHRASRVDPISALRNE